MAETWTIKSAGGDYTTLQAAENAKNGDLSGRGVVGFECYSGFDMGLCLVDGGTNQDSSNYLRIYAASGEEHDGKTTADNGCYIDTAVNNDRAIEVSDPYVRIEGLRFQVKLGSNFGNAYGIYSQNSGADNITIDSCVFVGTGTSTNGRVQGIRVSLNGSLTWTMTNCSFYDNSSCTASDHNAIYLFCGSGTGTANIYNCTAYKYSDAFYYFDGAGVLVVNSKNNVAMGASGGDFVAIGSPTVTQTYCCSSDATADDWGGSGNLISKTDSNQWTTVGSDHSVKNSSADIYGAGETASGVTVDILGTTRHSTPDIGAYEFDDVRSTPRSFGFIIG